jgi:hypothetical protein
MEQAASKLRSNGQIRNLASREELQCTILTGQQKTHISLTVYEKKKVRQPGPHNSLEVPDIHHHLNSMETDRKFETKKSTTCNYQIGVMSSQSNIDGIIILSQAYLVPFSKYKCTI